jgi:signal transduction histidine kinase
MFVAGVFRQSYISEYGMEYVNNEIVNEVNINNRYCTLNILGFKWALLMNISLIKSISIPQYCYSVLPCIVIVMVMIMLFGMVKYKVLDNVDFFRQKVIKRNVQGLNKNLRGVFHSFKNMLFTIDLTVKNLKLEENEEKRKEIENELETLIADSMDSVSRMLNTLKNFDVEFSKSNVIEILESAINKARTDKNINIIRRYSDDDMDIYADEFCMTHALANIIQNASDAVALAGREDGEIIIEAFPEQEWILIKITDNGTGIPKKDINNIFKEFYTSKSRSNNNWGLGLYYTYKVVKKHMGYVSVESKVGVKTTFQIVLPRWNKKARIRKGMSVYEQD